jgi:hypothetical protein
MRAAIWTFAKPSHDSVIASHRIAHALAKWGRMPIVYDAAPVVDTLFIVNGAYAFCKHLPLLARMVVRAERIVWVQNDYTIIPPRFTSEGGSPFRAAFRKRHRRGLPPIEIWSTCEAPKFSEGWGRRRYVNWNALTYAPLPWKKRAPHNGDLFYYGSYRKDRKDAFDRYLWSPRGYAVTLNVPRTGPWENYYRRGCTIEEADTNIDLREECARHGLGLYIEDRRSHKEFCSPANRFYEMLSAHLPMVFDKPTSVQLRRANLEVGPWAVRDVTDIRYCLRHRDEIRVEQHEEFGGCDYKDELRRKVKKMLRNEGVI